MKRLIPQYTILATLTLLVACDEEGKKAPPSSELDNDPDTAVTTAGSAGTDETADDDTDLFGGMQPELNVPEPVPSEPEPNTDDADGEPIVACASAVAVGENPMIDDFDDLDLNPLVVDNRDGSWYSYTDGTPDAALTMNAVSGSAVGREGGVLEVVGDAVEEYSGIGVGLRWSETGAERCYYDASLYDGFTFWARGRGAVRIALQNPSVRPEELGGQCTADSVCFDSHGMDIILSDEWTRYAVPFDEIEQAGWGSDVGDFLPAELFLIEFQFTAGVDYEMWLDEMTFYSGELEPLSSDAGAVVTDLDASSPMLDAGGVVSLDAATPDLDAGSLDASF